MKTAVTILVIILAVLASGCMASAPATPAPPAQGAKTFDTKTMQAIPDLAGTWTGTIKSFDYGTGFNDHPDGKMVITVTEQRDRIFTGNLTVITNNTILVTENFAGAIGRDGRTFTLAEESGYAFGEILGKDEFEMVYVNDASPFSIAIDSFWRT
ncbi:MAG: hypothetical protein M0Q91_02125 [Methanoregula sp.]|jgi:hypothetical protein|nr:hypothetical protein [Methanoregula sp.]